MAKRASATLSSQKHCIHRDVAKVKKMSLVVKLTDSLSDRQTV